jgi:hypothetical protein
MCESPSGPRAVINTLCLTERAAFTHPAAATDREDETTATRMARREATWMPIVVHNSA